MTTLMLADLVLVHWARREGEPPICGEYIMRLDLLGSATTTEGLVTCPDCKAELVHRRLGLPAAPGRNR